MGCPYVAARNDWISFLAKAFTHLLSLEQGSVMLLFLRPLEAYGHAHMWEAFHAHMFLYLVSLCSYTSEKN